MDATTKRMHCAPTLVTHARACGLHLGADRPHTHLEMFCLCGFIQEGEVGAEFLSPRPEWGAGSWTISCPGQAFF